MSASARLRAFVALLLLAAGLAQAQDDVRKLAAEARRSQAVGGAHALARLDFRFDGMDAWLLQDGSWYMEGMVQHRRALCADYRLGMQFGRGNPGCANVEWLTEEQYVTHEVQCNNALVRHRGGGIDPVAAENFDKITCAQRLISCSGHCR
jgi:hypothetical protein